MRMRIVSPESPLWWRLLVTAVPFCAAAYGLSEGSVPAGLVFGLAGGFVFHRLFLSV
ncbi:hypothetical protein [Paracoccus jiaweipingae]|uniref:hypothetical protein n=1 Tax=unclassified Paracoccus (in: a-proteobacteria) TaxID=2688777 RepID=UPI0037AB6129